MIWANSTERLLAMISTGRGWSMAERRILIAKAGLDGHDRGAKFIVRFLQDAGYKVFYTGIRRSPEQVVAMAIEKNVDAIGLSLLSGAHRILFKRVIDLLRQKGANDILVFGGGTIHESDIPYLEELGVAAIFTPGASSASILSTIGRFFDERECAAVGPGEAKHLERAGTEV